MFSSGAFGYLADYLLWWFLFLSLVVHAWCFFCFFPRRRRPKMALIVGNAMVFICLLYAVALAGESYFRFVAVETDGFGLSLPARRWFALHTKLNSLGCRDVEWSVQKPPGVRRIAFVGDSFTYGWGIENTEDRFSDLVGRELNRRGPGLFETLNVAKPGWDSGAQLQPIIDMIEVYGADEVVLGYVPNDIEKLLPTTADFNPTRPPTSNFCNLDGSCLLDYLYRRLLVPRIRTVRSYHDWLAQGFADPDIRHRHEQQLLSIIQSCRERNVKLRVVLLPFLRVGGAQYDASAIHSSLRKFFEQNDVPVVDLLAVIISRKPEEVTINATDAHPNQECHTLFAYEILKTF